MSWASLTLFPPYSLDTSILVAVLVGVLVLALLTETLGWVFVGLVVPGYLASVLVIHPEAGFTVIFEAVVTYALAVGLSRGLSRTGAWSEFFGRERFFLVVLASVLVRAVSEAWLLPTVGGMLDQQLGTTFTLDRSLHSIGLVLVPLTANAFWKLRLGRGLLQVGLPVLVTYGALQLLLLPFTNLSFSSLELTYEDIAQTFLASPKAYIILLTTAVLAARFNLKYGWDFNGILVPALIALTWMTPSKLVATGLEVLVLVAGTQALLRLPGLSTLNLEGPRKTVLVFTFGFGVKYALGWVFGGNVPGLKVTDLFGFGYLVPTLLAVKILQKQVVVRTLLATAHTSFAGVVVGSLLGFALSLVEPRPVVAEQPEPTAGAPSLGLLRSAEGVMAIGRATARENGSEARPLPRRRGQLRRYGALWSQIDPWLDAGGEGGRRGVERAAASLGLRLVPIDPGPSLRQRYALLEQDGVTGKVGWDTAVLIPGARGPVLEIPRPLYEAPAAEAAAVLCDRVDCRAIISSGLDTRGRFLHQGDPVLSEATPLHTAHLALADHPRVVLRADGRLPRRGAVLHLPAKLKVSEALWPGAHRTAEAPPEPGLAWADGQTAILRANPDDLAHALVATTSLAPTLDWLTAQHRLAAPSRWSGPVRPQPTAEELLVLEHQVASILLDVNAERGHPLEPYLRLRWASRMAGLLGLAVHPVKGCGQDCYLVVEQEGAAPVGAGLLVRAGRQPLALEVPVPGHETGTLELGLEMFSAADARALVFAGPLSSLDPGHPHPATSGNYRTAFQAFHQAAHRALDPGGAVLQLRGFAARAGLEADALVDLDRPVLGEAGRSEAIERLFAPGGALRWLSADVRYHQGSQEQVGLADSSPQQGFSRAYGGASHATLWLAEPLRRAYVAPRRAFEQLGLVGFGPFPLAPRDPERALGIGQLDKPVGRGSRALQSRFAALMATAERAVREQSVHDLLELARPGRAGAVHTRVEALWSPRHQLPYLLVEAQQGRTVLRGVQFLHDGHSAGEASSLRAGEEGAEAALAVALRTRAPVVLSGEVRRPARGGGAGGGR